MRLDPPLVVHAGERLRANVWTPGAFDVESIRAYSSATTPRAAQQVCAALSLPSVAVWDAAVAQPFCMMIPSAVAHLVAEGCWTALLLRLSWNTKSHKAMYTQLMESLDFPSQQWAKTLKSTGRLRRYASDTRVPFLPRHATQLAQDLKRWAPKIVDGANEDEGERERFQLEQAVRRLEGVEDDATPEHTFKFDPFRVVSALSAAMDLKNRHRLWAIVQKSNKPIKHN